YTWIVDTDTPTIMCSPPIDLHCNPTSLPTAEDAANHAVATDPDCGSATVHCVSAGPDTGTCVVTRTFTCTATDIGGNVSEPCFVIYTWTVDQDAPVFSGCPTAPIALPCNSSPTCADAL